MRFPNWEILVNLVRLDVENYAIFVLMPQGTGCSSAEVRNTFYHATPSHYCFIAQLGVLY